MLDNIIYKSSQKNNYQKFIIFQLSLHVRGSPRLSPGGPRKLSTVSQRSWLSILRNRDHDGRSLVDSLSDSDGDDLDKGMLGGHHTNNNYRYYEATNKRHFTF